MPSPVVGWLSPPLLDMSTIQSPLPYGQLEAVQTGSSKKCCAIPPVMAHAGKPMCRPLVIAFGTGRCGGVCQDFKYVDEET